MAMILSAAMMLEWLGIRYENAAMSRDGARLRDAVEAVSDEGLVLTPDIGGTATTQEVALAISRRLFP